MGANKNAYIILVGKLGRKRLLEGPGKRWENATCIEMDFTEIMWCVIDWINLSYNRN
jgi:hypothetical protein